MKAIALLTILVALTVSAGAQEAGPSLERSAQDLASKMSALDSLAVANMFPDALTRSFGGTGAIASELEKTYEPLRRNSLKTQVKLAPPSALGKEGRWLFSFVPYMHTIAPPGGKVMTRYSYFLALSSDEGRTWKFMEGDQPPALFDQILPNYNGTPPRPVQLPNDQYQ